MTSHPLSTGPSSAQLFKTPLTSKTDQSDSDGEKNGANSSNQDDFAVSHSADIMHRPSRMRRTPFLRDLVRETRVEVA